MTPDQNTTGGITIVYDGDCPFCSNYVTMARLRAAAGPVRLIDAREGGEEARWLQYQGYDLNEGMAMIEDGEVHHGADCLTRMALLSTESDWFNRLNARIFRSPGLSRALYPVLRGGRNLTLRLMRRRPI
ncbi:DCC1-like thiol-disulfide oxidoreductase family protein [Pseudoruegeria sp. HB172150]|uniref:DCC1-like thiol-disulfide oxidoreductase family protein n=1 Tax=Pseudoruegeria sp. HB172150 TaxID=2721164 RepID=UPI0015580831|nr:DCC1-like thiol-disulfide oxidoreductase family protein [Pseudoruegeria sp. HB172150]